jgi:hypothetical protein
MIKELDMETTVRDAIGQQRACLIVPGRIMKQILWIPRVCTALLLCALHLPVSAQSSDSAFVSLCKGDVSSWMRIPSRRIAVHYSAPSIESSTVQRDTIIDGGQYIWLEYPPEMGLPAGWMRSDPAGLYLRNGDNDTLRLPAHVELNDVLPDGKVFEILTVLTQFGELPAYRVTRTVFPGKRYDWTWVPIVGLWECSILQGDAIIHYHFLSGSRCGRGSPDVPAALDVPLRSGDILVHEVRQKSASETAYRVQSSYEILEGTRWIHSEPGGGDEYTVRHLKVRVNTAGHVFYDAADAFGGDTDTELYPAYIPALDTVLLDGLPYEVLARFDTLMFSDTVRACILRCADPNAPRTLVYADRFGLIFEETDTFAATLHSARIRGNTYNRQAEVRRWLPLCDGSVYEYRMTGPFSDTYGRMKLRDSTFAGRTSVFFNPPGMAVMGMGSLRYPLRGLMTEHAEGVRSSRGNMLLPFASDLGDTTATGMVIALEERNLFGKLRRVMRTAKVSEDVNRRDVFVEDIGLYASDILERGFGRFVWTLSGAIVCGESVGTPLSVESDSFAPVASEMTLYPHPATAGAHVGVSVTVAGSGAYQLVVTDVLGRTQLARVVSLSEGRNTLQLPLHEFSSGSYILSLRNGEVVISAIFLVTP